MTSLGWFRKCLGALGALCWASWVGPVLAAPTASTPAKVLLERADARGLALSETWLRLGHYRRGSFGHWQSEADGEGFFLAQSGKDDPHAELAATLAAFYAPVSEKEPDQHALCRFPARFAWLANELTLDVRSLPRVRCARYGEFLALLRPRQLTLVFSSYYLNNPASAFGHTFLRVDRETEPGKKSAGLLAYGIDYSATVDTGNALLYAFKGLFGLFPGVFRKVPYHVKVREYNDYESRDLWEYELALSKEQVGRVIAHLWELGQTYFAYYYLTENCSYHVLGLLEVADPKLSLLRGLGAPVIPADTVKALLKNRGLVRSVNYRPSNRTQFQQRVDRLNADELAAVMNLMRDPRARLASSLSEAERVRALDTAIDLLDMRLARDVVKARSAMDAEGSDAQQVLLERRAELLVASEEFEFEPPRDKMPHVGHGSRRLGLGSGYQETRGYYHTLSFRLALHDLLDPAKGYPETAEIEFLNATARYYVEQPRLSLEHASLITVRSLTNVSRFDHKLSWAIDTGVTRVRDRGCRDCFSAFGELAGGFSFGPATPLLVYALADARLYAPFEAGLWDTLRIGAGPLAGMRLRFSDDATLLGTFAWLYLPGQEPRSTWDAHGLFRLSYARNFGLGVEARLTPSAGSVQGVSYLYF